MALKQVLGLVNRGSDYRRTTQDFLLSPPHFEAALRRERLRADRNRSSFCLLTLSLEHGSGETDHTAMGNSLRGASARPI